MSSRAGPSSEAQGAPQRRITRTQTAGNLGEAIFDSEVVPSSLVEIAPILRVANEVEKTHPRVAYLCKFVSFCTFSALRLPRCHAETSVCSCTPKCFMWSCGFSVLFWFVALIIFGNVVMWAAVSLVSTCVLVLGRNSLLASVRCCVSFTDIGSVWKQLVWTYRDSLQLA